METNETIIKKYKEKKISLNDCALWLFNINQGMIKRWIYPYSRDEQEKEDLLQESYFAVCEALESHDSSKGKFTTWLSYFVKKQCTQYRIDSSLIGMSCDMLQKIKKYNDTYKLLMHQFGAEPRPGQMALYMQISLDEVTHIRNCMQSLKSLDATIMTEESEDTTILDLLEDTETNVENEAIEKEKKRALLNALDILDDKRQSYVIYQHYIAGKTLNQIGVELGISDTRVKQLKDSGLRRMRKKDISDTIIDFYDTVNIYLMVGVDTYQRTSTSSVELLALNHVSFKND